MVLLNLNRRAMADTIVKGMGFHIENRFTTIHNYIDIDKMILRKGAVSAQSGETLIIPINMRDGSLICTGKCAPCALPEKTDKKLTQKPNEKNDKYDIKLLYSTAFIPRFA